MLIQYKVLYKFYKVKSARNCNRFMLQYVYTFIEIYWSCGDDCDSENEYRQEKSDLNTKH